MCVCGHVCGQQHDSVAATEIGLKLESSVSDAATTHLSRCRRKIHIILTTSFTADLHVV